MARFGYTLSSEEHPAPRLVELAVRAERLILMTGVTCPTVRIHPAVVAQAAATTATLLPGRFWFGVGTGENLNEHILGDPGSRCGWGPCGPTVDRSGGPHDGMASSRSASPAHRPSGPGGAGGRDRAGSR